MAATKRRYRIIDFKRLKDGVPAKVADQYDEPVGEHRAPPYLDGEKAYILAPAQLRVGVLVQSGPDADIKVGNALPLENIPTGTLVHNVELKPGQGARWRSRFRHPARREGRDSPCCVSWARCAAPLACRATVGQVGNVDHQNINWGKAGRNRWKGKRPSVRGSAMSPSTTRTAASEGKSKGGRHPVTPWGVPTLGKRTRSKHKESNKLIVRGRRRGKDTRR